ncbi:MFS transporter [Paenibacillus polymyxa]|uniref:MFS transporter n=1 Tax=Paenibacillus polymyxa TaxID=1406 RepID=UPI000471FFE7|nr:MFS transporter [Paenibacillus polymyxa]
MSKFSIHKRYSVFVGVIMSSFSMIDKLYGAVYIILMNLKGINSTQIGVIFAISSLSMAIFDYPSGNLSDRYGRKKFTGIGFIIWGIGLFVFAFASSSLLFISAVVIMSLGISFITGSPQAWYIDKLNELNMKEYKDISIPVINGFITGFAVIGALLATITSQTNFSFPIILGGIIALFLGIVVLLKYKDNYGGRSEDNIFKEIYITTVNFIKDKNMIVILIRNALTFGGLIGFLLTWQVYGVNVLHLKVSYLAGLLIVFMGVISLASFIVALLVRKTYSLMKITLLGTFISAIGLFIIGINSNIITFLAGAILFEFGWGVETSAYSSWVHDYLPSEKRATFYSGLSALESLSGFFLTLLIGFFTDYFGYSFIWYFSSTCFIASSIFLFYLQTPFLKKRGESKNEKFLG